VELRRQVVQAHHDSAITGHPGRWKTVELVSRNYWWPNMTRFIASYVRGCDRCNRTKTFPKRPLGKLTPNQIPTKPWQIITVDLITGLPDSHGYNSIMVVVDRLSKLIHVAPTTDKVTSEGIARLFRDHVWKLHGLPEQVISDRGPQFVSTFMRELNKLLGIRTTPSTAYHPQTDGQTERVNQEIEQYLRLFVNYRQDDWVEWLPLAEFSHNNRIQASTRQTPFHAELWSTPKAWSGTLLGQPRWSQLRTLSQRMKGHPGGGLRQPLQQAAEDMARFYDLHRGKAPDYKVGDLVWLDGKDLKTERPSKKLEDKRYGPYKITKKISPSAYELKLPHSMKVHPVFNTSRLSPL
jgi:hypothetical protein